MQFVEYSLLRRHLIGCFAIAVNISNGEDSELLWIIYGRLQSNTVQCSRVKATEKFTLRTNRTKDSSVAIWVMDQIGSLQIDHAVWRSMISMQWLTKRFLSSDPDSHGIGNFVERYIKYQTKRLIVKYFALAQRMQCVVRWIYLAASDVSVLNWFSTGSIIRMLHHSIIQYTKQTSSYLIRYGFSKLIVIKCN